MKKLLLSISLISLLIGTCAPVLAANWVTVEERLTATYQIDAQTVKFTGEDADRQLDIWVKIVSQESAGTFLASHYIVKENPLAFLMPERDTYSAVGQVVNKFTSDSEKWIATTPSSPIGAIATRLFADYRKNPEAFKDQATLTELAVAGNVPQSPKANSGQVSFDPQEVTKALADHKINNGQNPDGTRWYYVRDTWTSRHLLNSEHMTADFWLTISGSTKEPRFNFTFSDSRSGSHTIKDAVAIRIDDRDWILAQPVFPGATRFPEGMFQYSFLLPESLLQALLTTNNGITVKWKHSWEGWKDYEYTIPAETVRYIQLMYAGCK